MKKPKNIVLAQLSLEKHNTAFVEEKQKNVTSILDEIIDNVCEREPEPTECSETQKCSDPLLQQMKEKFNKITFFQVKNVIFFSWKRSCKVS